MRNGILVDDMTVSDLDCVHDHALNGGTPSVVHRKALTGTVAVRVRGINRPRCWYPLSFPDKVAVNSNTGRINAHGQDTHDK